MKYKSQTYAVALANAISEGNVDDKKIVANFLVLLQKNQDIKKAKEIISLTERILLARAGNKKVILEKARNVFTDTFIKKFTRKGDEVEEIINPNLIAGIKVIVDNEKQLDLSLSAKLENIFK